MRLDTLPVRLTTEMRWPEPPLVRRRLTGTGSVVLGPSAGVGDSSDASTTDEPLLAGSFCITASPAES